MVEGCDPYQQLPKRQSRTPGHRSAHDLLTRGHEGNGKSLILVDSSTLSIMARGRPNRRFQKEASPSTQQSDMLKATALRVASAWHTRKPSSSNYLVNSK